jgi:hypothetical protein
MPKTVYVTARSRVYHLSPKCRHLAGEAKRTTDVAAQKKGITKVCSTCQALLAAKPNKGKSLP